MTRYNNKSERYYRGKCLGWPVTSYGGVQSTFARIFLFLEQFSLQASLNSRESILYSALYCVVFCSVVLCCIVYRGYYTVARRYEFYVRVARTISHE